MFRYLVLGLAFSLRCTSFAEIATVRTQSLPATPMGGGHILYIGDSHTVGFFGDAFLNTLKEGNYPRPVRMEALVDSKPAEWVDGTTEGKRAQRYVSRKLEKNNVTIKSSDTKLPPNAFKKLETEEKNHDTNVFALGANLVGYPYSYVKDNIESILTRMNPQHRCIWIGAPRMNLTRMISVNYSQSLGKSPEERAQILKIGAKYQMEKINLAKEDKMSDAAYNSELANPTQDMDAHSLWFKIQRALIELAGQPYTVKNYKTGKQATYKIPSCSFIALHRIRDPSSQATQKPFVIPAANGDGLHFNGSTDSIAYKRASFLGQYAADEVRKIVSARKPGVKRYRKDELNQGNP